MPLKHLNFSFIEMLLHTILFEITEATACQQKSQSWPHNSIKCIMFDAVRFICRKYVGMAMVWYGILFIHIGRISTRPMFKRERAKYLQIHTY